MVNIYVLATGDLVSPWSRDSTYDGRYLRCATSGHGGTGGATQHRHLTIATDSANSTQMAGGDSGSNTGSVHSHPIDAQYSGYSDNDPLYYTLALWKMDATDWEDSYRSFPQNTVVLSYTSISATGFSRWTSGDDRLIKLGDPGSSGGRSTHDDHSLTATLTNVSPSAISCSYGSTNNCGYIASHGHTVTIASYPASTSFPLLLKTRLYYTTTATDRAPAGIVCFFDSTPSSNWSLVTGWADRFPMSFNSDPTNDGADHGHGATVGTSTTYSYGNYYTRWSGTKGLAKDHNHSCTIALDTTNPEPEYVDLVPYRLTTTLLVPNGASTIMMLMRTCTGAFTK